MKTKKTKEPKAKGMVVLNHEVYQNEFKIPLLEGGFIDVSTGKRPHFYRWLNGNTGFQIFYNNRWQSAKCTDFIVLNSEEEIIKSQFNGYRDTNAYAEISDWSAKDLKEFLKILGYKSYTKDIMVSMLSDLVRIVIFKEKLLSPNPFLVKVKV